MSKNQFWIKVNKKEKLQNSEEISCNSEGFDVISGHINIIYNYKGMLDNVEH